MDAVTACHVIDLIAMSGISSLAVASTGVVYGQSFPLPRNATFGWEFQFTSPGTTNVKIELEQGNERPTTEGSADANKMVLPDGGGQISAGITDENDHIIGFAPKVSGFARLKLTGLAGNDAGTVLSKAKCTYVLNS